MDSTAEDDQLSSTILMWVSSITSMEVITAVSVVDTPSGPKQGGVLRYASGNGIVSPGYTPECTNNASLLFLTTAYESLVTSIVQILLKCERICGENDQILNRH